MIKKIYFKRVIALFLVYIILLAALCWRVKLRTVDESGKLSVWADSQYTDVEKITDLNYVVFDKNGKQLLDYKNKYYAVIDASAFVKNNMNTKTDDLYALIYILRNYNDKYDLSTIGINNSSGKVNFEIDEDTYNKLKNIKDVKGFYTYTYSSVDRSEAWKIENLISNTRKPDGTKIEDTDSLEMQINKKTSQNQYPKIEFDKDIQGNITSQQFIAPSNNTNVRLTIDKNLEDTIKGVLVSDKYKKLGQIGAVLMESSSGKILAMTQKDDTQPNVTIGAATQNGFEPGSIFKVIVEEAGLDNKSISLTNKYHCKQNIYTGIYDKDPDKDHGILTPEQALVVSCNNTFAQIGDQVGVDNFIGNAQSQGLFSKVLNFSTEVTGDFVSPQKGERAGQLAIGQSMRITPIQAISIANTVVNSGVYVKPYIIDAYVDNENKEIEKVKTKQFTAINKSTANSLKSQMQKVVKEGTGESAYIDNMELGGKTGTSTRFDGKNNTSDGWFVGFFKIKNKYYSMVVFAKDIDTKNEQAATTAAPVFKDIVLAINNYLGGKQ